MKLVIEFADNSGRPINMKKIFQYPMFEIYIFIFG
jgi:hypothetical protein